MTRRPRPFRFWIEATLAVVSCLLLVLTAINDEWIEAFGIEPDGGSGAAEWGITFVLIAVALGAGAAAVVDWRRAAATGS